LIFGINYLEFRQLKSDGPQFFLLYHDQLLALLWNPAAIPFINKKQEIIEKHV
jgi:hypothetical protein